MARSTKGLYKRGNVWRIIYFDALGSQRFESSKSSNKKERRSAWWIEGKKLMRGCCLLPPIKPAAFALRWSSLNGASGEDRGPPWCHSPCGHFLLANRSS